MINIILSDIFRLRKGVAFRNVLLGGVIIVLFTGFLTSTISSRLLEDGDKTMPPERITSSEMYEAIPNNTMEFVVQIQGNGTVPIFILVFVIAVMGADYSFGTSRNTLSYETDRKKVYLAKYLLCLLCSLMFNLVYTLSGWLFGGLFFGFEGFSVEYFERVGVNLLLLIPLDIGLIGICACIIFFTKKNSSTIAIYLMGIVISAIITQGLYLHVPSMQWAMYLDPASVCVVLSRYWLYPIGDIVFITIVWLVIGAAAAYIAMKKYKTDDM